MPVKPADVGQISSPVTVPSVWKTRVPRRTVVAADQSPAVAVARCPADLLLRLGGERDAEPYEVVALLHRVDPPHGSDAS